jgi:creatinine amidohydrolase/Fe(II)-dependent formamide hydrolase-like protein
LATPEKGGALVALAAKSLIEDLADFSAETRV